jgi:hypothetical protein
MTPAMFADMTPREFANAVTGYAQELEQASRERWEQSRMTAYYAVAPHLKKGQTMHSMIPLPWDASQTTSAYGNFRTRPTDEQIEMLLAKLDKIQN